MIARLCSFQTFALLGMLAMFAGISAASAQVQRAARPVAEPSALDFTAPLTVSLTTPTPGSTIFYTVDGSIPDTVAGGTTLMYAGPIAITATTQINAIAVKTGAGWFPSEISTLIYTLFPSAALQGRPGEPEPSRHAARPISCYSVKGSWLGSERPPSAVQGTWELPGKQVVILR